MNNQFQSDKSFKFTFSVERKEIWNGFGCQIAGLFILNCSSSLKFNLNQKNKLTHEFLTAPSENVNQQIKPPSETVIWELGRNMNSEGSTPQFENALKIYNSSL